MTAPVPKRVEMRREHHDDVFIDHYEWMRDKSDPEVIAHLEAENAHVEDETSYQEPLRQQIFDEIKARTKETDLSVPIRRGEWWYYGRSFEGKQYGVHCRCPVSGPDDWDPPQLDENTDIPGEQILLDENVKADGHDFFAVGASSVSPDGNLLAYSTDVVGDERYTLRFRTYVLAISIPTRSVASRRGSRGPPIVPPCTTPRSTRHGVRTPCGGTRSAQRESTSKYSMSPTSGFGSR